MKRVKIGLKTAEMISWFLYYKACDGETDYKTDKALESLDRAIARVAKQ